MDSTYFFLLILLEQKKKINKKEKEIKTAPRASKVSV